MTRAQNLKKIKTNLLGCSGFVYIGNYPYFCTLNDCR